MGNDKKIGKLCRRASAFLLSAALLFTGINCVQPLAWALEPESAGLKEIQRPQDGWYAPKEHSPLYYEQMLYVPYDRSAADAAMDELETLCAATDPKDAEEREKQAVELYLRILDEIDQMETKYVLNELEYYKDVSDGAAASEKETREAECIRMEDRAMGVLKSALGSSLGSALEREMGERIAGVVRDYKAMSERELALSEEETKLVMEYDTKARQLDEQGAALRERNDVLGEVFIRLVGVRTELARESGYDNYADYAYKVLYNRDFSEEDVKTIRGQVKRYIADTWMETAQAADEIGVEEALEKYNDSTGEQRLDAIEPYLGRIDPDLMEAFQYMRTHRLYDIEESSQKADVGFTINLYAYGVPFIFDSPYGDYYDYSTAIHEFGHFNSMFHENVRALFEDAGLDVSEVHSQGLELLFSEYAGGIFDRAGEAFQYNTVLEMLNSVIEGCRQDEFQWLVYSEPDMTLDRMNAEYLRISKEYGYVYDSGDRVRGAYDWVDIPHTFQSPMYYISYATSALSSLDIWLQSVEDRQSGVNKYMALTALGSSVPYREALRECGLRDVFLAGTVEEIAGLIPEVMAADGTSWHAGGFAPTQYAVVIIAAILALLVAAILCRRAVARRKIGEAAAERRDDEIRARNTETNKEIE